MDLDTRTLNASVNQQRFAESTAHYSESQRKVRAEALQLQLT